MRKFIPIIKQKVGNNANSLIDMLNEYKKLKSIFLCKVKVPCDKDEMPILLKKNLAAERELKSAENPLVIKKCEVVLSKNNQFRI